MRRRNRELGEGKVGCIISLIILLFALFVAYKMIPVKVRASQLRQTIIDEAKSAGMHKNPTIRRNIMEKAEELELPLDPNDLLVNRRANTISIEATYQVPVEFPGFTYNWNFHHEYENPVF
ncbi:MAG TPA: hypothetical protein VIL97_11730 [Thermoanaerobaculia bacterium]